MASGRRRAPRRLVSQAPPRCSPFPPVLCQPHGVSDRAACGDSSRDRDPACARTMAARVDQVALFRGPLRQPYGRPLHRGFERQRCLSAAGEALAGAKDRGHPQRLRLRAVPRIAAALREQLQIPPQAPVLVVVARLEPQKGHAVLLRALPRVLASFPATRLICVGAGSLAADLRAEAGALRVAHAVRFAGFQADIRPFLALAAISILPSFYEGMPLVAMESLAAGVAMIATDVDGTPEIIVHGQTGLLVPPGDPAALAAAILRLLADDSLRAALAANGQAWVRRRFDRHRQIQATQELYVSAWRESCEKRAYARGGAAWDGDSMHQERSS